MPDPLVITFPGSAFKAQMLSAQKIFADSISRQQPLPISVIMDYINLTDSNIGLERKLIARGDFVPNGDILVNNSNRIIHERLYDTGDQLKEVWLDFPKKLAVRVIEEPGDTIKLDFTAGDPVICVAKGLPDSAGLGESFIAQSLRFHPNGTETILKEEFGEGIIQILVDYNLPMNASLKIRYEGKAFRSKFFNTLSASFANDPCCGGPVQQPPRQGRGIIPVHFRILYTPQVSVQTQVAKANAWLDDYNLEIEIKSIKTLNLPQFQILDLALPGTTATCIMGRSSAEQNDLYINYRDGIPQNEIAVFYVYATTPAYAGCASYPVNFPSAVVIGSAVNETLPHELCHILGLSHVNNNYRLMTGNGTYQIVSPPPDLVNTELDTIWQSPYLRIIN